MASPPAPSPIPKDRALDGTLAFRREGYRFISNRCESLGSDVFETRLFLRRAICLRGAEAAALLYENEKVTRRGAMPKSVLALLQDEGSVQQLDGAAHRHRKALFMSMTTGEAVGRLCDCAGSEWRRAAEAWESRGGTVVLHDAAREILCRAACRWAGVPLAEAEVEARTAEFGAMIDGAGRLGPRNWAARLRRRRNERWVRDVLRGLRDGSGPPGDSGSHGAETPAAAIAAHRDPEGQPLGEEEAAVELINLLRPIVAVARFIVFAALAVHRHPEAAERLAAGDGAYLAAFVQEVRRYYPFFPVVGGRVLRPLTWRGHALAAGDWLLLDLYGTNQHPALWTAPEVFRPERFLSGGVGRNALVPQGGGDPHGGHRCPGEDITLALMAQAVRFLTRELRYELPPQDLSVRLDRIPALPESGFVIGGVKRAG